MLPVALRAIRARGPQSCFYGQVHIVQLSGICELTVQIFVEIFGLRLLLGVHKLLAGRIKAGAVSPVGVWGAPALAPSVQEPPLVGSSASSSSV